MAEAFPPSWLRPEMRQLIIDFIKHQPIGPKYKKRMLHEWCTIVGVEMTASMVEQVTGLRAGEI